MRLALGSVDERSPSTDGENQTDYGLFTLDRDYPGLGRLRVFEMLKLARDTIPDDRREPTPFIESITTQPLVRDTLPFQDTWVNSAWIGFDYSGVPHLNVGNKLKHELYRQRDGGMLDLEGRPFNKNSSFFGLINKVDYRRDFGRFTLQPKFKSEFMRQTPFLEQEERLERWTGTALLLGQFPVLTHTLLRGGLEILWLRDRVTDEEDMVRSGRAGETGDLQTTTLAMQLSTTSGYLGYKLTTEIGLRFSRTRTELVELSSADRFVKGNESATETVSFITVYAGVE